MLIRDTIVLLNFIEWMSFRFHQNDYPNKRSKHGHQLSNTHFFCKHKITEYRRPKWGCPCEYAAHCYWQKIYGNDIPVLINEIENVSRIESAP